MASKRTPANRFSPELSNVARSLLEAFRARRLFLKLCSRCSTTVVLWVALLSLAILLDALWIHDAAPWIGAIPLYLLTLAILCYVCLVPRLEGYDLRNEARRFEKRDPRLREKLLSAVELCDSDSAVVDSAEFRSQLQRDVAQLMQSVDVKHLLPWSQVRRRVTWATSLLLAVFCLCWLPHFHLAQRAARILMPWGDWGRVSHVAITLERPVPHSKLIPLGDLASITARIDGPPPDSMWLETRTPQGAVTTYPMTVGKSQPTPPRWPLASAVTRFEGLLTANSPSLEYRVQGAGASTPWYEFTTLPRPSIREFEITLTPPLASAPSSTNLPPPELQASVHRAEHGNLSALVGSYVWLRVSVDQPTQVAELRWVNASSESELTAKATTDANAAVPLHLDPSTGQLTVDFPVVGQAAYKIHVQSLTSGFTNSFSPTYHITAIADEAPLIAWLVPAAPRLVLSADEVLRLQNSVTDELPLASLLGWTNINGSEWQSRSLSAQPVVPKLADMRTPSPVLWELNLPEMHLKAGDKLEVKLSATDHSGQTAESAVLVVDIASTSLALDANLGEKLRRALSADLQSTAQRLSELQPLYEQAKLETYPSAETWRQSFRHVANAYQQQLVKTRQHLLECALAADTALHGQTLIDIGDRLLRLSQLHAQRLGWLERLSARPEQPQLAQGIRETSAQLPTELQLTHELVQQTTVLVTQDAVVRHASQLYKLAEVARELSKLEAASQSTSQQLSRRQSSLLEQMQQVQRSMLDESSQLRPETRLVWQAAGQQLGQSIYMADRLQSTVNSTRVTPIGQVLAGQLDQLRTLSRLDASLPTATEQAHAHLSAPPETWPEIVPHTSRPPGPTSIPTPTPELARLLESLWAKRELERAAPQGDRLYAADLGQARRALEKLNSSSIPLSPALLQQAAHAIGQALNTLQAVHQVREVDNLLSELFNVEDWSNQPGDDIWRGPQTWDVVLQRWQQAVGQLRAVKFAPAVTDRLEQWGRTLLVQQAQRKFDQRIVSTQPPTSAATEMQMLREQLGESLRELESAALVARKTIDAYAPHVSELAQLAAQDVQAMAQQSTDLAQAMERDEVPDPVASLEQWAHHSQALDEPLDRLREALVDRADSQNLLQPEQAQMARQADQGIAVVDRQRGRVEQASVPLANSLDPPNPASQLHRAAQLQNTAADALEQLAEFFQGLERPASSATSPVLANQHDIQTALDDLASPEPGVDANTPDPSTENPYDLAEQLAALAAQDPRSVLEHLEQELKRDEPMAIEMSTITRRIVEQAVQELEQAAQHQHALAQDLELSDATFKAQKQLLMHDLQIVQAATRQLLDTLVKEVLAASSTSKNNSVAEQLNQAQLPLRTALPSLNQFKLNHPFSDLLAVAADHQAQLVLLEQQLRASTERLAQASVEEFHQSGADLANRRREMQDRQRRLQQESVRDAQTIHRQEQQSLGQLEQQLNTPSELQAALASRVQAAQEHLEQLNARQLPPLDSVNPTAQLAWQLSQQASSESQRWGKRLATWQTAQLATLQASAPALTNSERQQQQIADSVEQTTVALSRAARHEARLDQPQLSSQLDQLAQATEQLSDGELQQAANQLTAAKRQAIERGGPQGQASATASAEAQFALHTAAEALERAATGLRGMLAPTPSDSSNSVAAKGTPETANQSQPSSVASTSEPFPLSAAQKVRLLDELDQRLQAEFNLGPKDNDAPAAPNGTPAAIPPTGTLSDAASQLSKRLSQSRQPSAPPASTADLARATQSSMANPQPQPPIPVRLLQVERRGGDWGVLREQNTTERNPSNLDPIARRYRKQIDAYFREVAERGGIRQASP
jgi:hypothetical protein